MLSRNDVKELVINNIHTIMRDFKGTIDESTNLWDGVGADSIDFATLLTVLEDEFDREIPDNDVKTLTTVGSIVDYIMSKLDGIEE